MKTKVNGLSLNTLYNFPWSHILPWGRQISFATPGIKDCCPSHKSGLNCLSKMSKL
jgi:hypothetical protein